MSSSDAVAPEKAVDGPTAIIRSSQDEVRTVELEFDISARPSKFDLRTSQDIAGELRTQVTDPESEFRQTFIGSLVDGNFFRTFDLFGATLAFLASLDVWQLILLLLGMLLLTVSSYLYIRWTNPEANNSILPVICFTLADVVSDGFFAWSLEHLEGFEKEFIASLVFLILPLCVNSVILHLVLREERRTNSRWSEFVRRHSSMYYFTIVLSLGNPGNMRLLSSEILKAERFSGPLSEHTDYQLQLGGLVTVLLEDIPQFVLQLLVLQKQEELEMTTVLALVFTSLALLFSFGKRIYIYIYGVDDLDESKVWGDDVPDTELPEYLKRSIPMSPSVHPGDDDDDGWTENPLQDHEHFGNDDSQADRNALATAQTLDDDHYHHDYDDDGQKNHFGDDDDGISSSAAAVSEEGP